MTPKTKGLSEIHLAVLLWGFAGLFPKLIPLPSVVVVALRMLIAAGILRLILFFSGKKIRPPSHKHAYIFIVCGFLMGINMIAYYQAIQISTVTIGVLSAGIFPVFVTLLEPVYFNEKLRFRNLAVALLAFGGLVIMTANSDMHSSATHGVLWGLMAAMAFANLTVLNRKYVQEYSSVIITYYQCLVAGVLLTPVLLCDHYTLTVHAILLTVVAAVVFSVVSETLYIKGMRHVKAHVAAVASNLEPCYAVILAFFLLREVPTVQTLIGGALIVGTTLEASLHSRSPSAPPLPG